MLAVPVGLPVPAVNFDRCNFFLEFFFFFSFWNSSGARQVVM